MIYFVLFLFRIERDTLGKSWRTHCSLMMISIEFFFIRCTNPSYSTSRSSTKRTQILSKGNTEGRPSWRPSTWSSNLEAEQQQKQHEKNTQLITSPTILNNKLVNWIHTQTFPNHQRTVAKVWIIYHTVEYPFPVGCPHTAEGCPGICYSCQHIRRPSRGIRCNVTNTPHHSELRVDLSTRSRLQRMISAETHQYGIRIFRLSNSHLTVS